jgi:hypothetical protein
VTRRKKMKKHLFLCSIIAIVALACNNDDFGGVGAEIIDSSPSYSISVIPKKEVDGSYIVLSNTDGIITISPAGKVKKNMTVTLSVYPELIAFGGEGDNEEEEYWFVNSISSSYITEDGTKTSYAGIRPVLGETNKWNFRMPPGDLTITFDFTQEYPDETNADLGALYVSNGVISPNFSKNIDSYTIAVPFGATEFVVSAQAENPYLEPVMLSPYSGNKDLLDEDLMAPENGGPLDEGLHCYTIRVTSEDGKMTKTYTINVVQLPDLSLNEFKVTRGAKINDDYFERDLASIDKQTVYVPYTDGITVVAKANDDSAHVSISPDGIISEIEMMNAKTATVTVSKQLPDVEASLTSKDYVLDLYYGEGMSKDPLAEGGYVSFLPGETGLYYEVHTFMAVGTYTLSFFDTETTSIQADWLIVAGGGGAGGASWWVGGGGGGAGGLLYQTGQTLNLESGSVSVAVGAGGAGGGGNKDGSDGGGSSIGAIVVPGGGGGGGSADSFYPQSGREGGSGGGGGKGYGSSHSAGGANTATGEVRGNSGGAGGLSSSYGGGGGGGAGGAGAAPVTASPGIGGAGGLPWIPEGDAAWIKAVVNTKEFSRGGTGGSEDGSGTGAAGLNYGSGGSGGSKYGSRGGAGHRGVVIVRFQRTLESPSPSP